MCFCWLGIMIGASDNILTHDSVCEKGDDSARDVEHAAWFGELLRALYTSSFYSVCNRPSLDIGRGEFGMRIVAQPLHCCIHVLSSTCLIGVPGCSNPCIPCPNNYGPLPRGCVCRSYASNLDLRLDRQEGFRGQIEH